MTSLRQADACPLPTTSRSDPTSTVTFTRDTPVRTPKGRGRIVHYFPAEKKPELATYSVKIKRHAHALVFRVDEVRKA